jgi:uncharacterized repeat protein (TIGR01451 family)
MTGLLTAVFLLIFFYWSQRRKRPSALMGRLIRAIGSTICFLRSQLQSGLNRAMVRLRRSRAWSLSGLFILSTFLSLNIHLIAPPVAVAASEVVAPGAYIIDMGQPIQTIANGLKPYGLIYELVVKKGIPVKWAIDPNKVRDGADFVAGSKTYRGGSFIIPAEFAAEAAATVNSWKAQGVVVDGPTTAGFTAPIYTNLDRFPNTVLDSANGAIVGSYFTNAGIPASSTGAFGSFTTYQFLPPSALSACHDIYAMPHADPTWSVHQNLIPFNQSKGFIWAACHAVSVLERVDDPGDADPLPDMNFLSHVPPAGQDSLSLKVFGRHVTPTAGPYTYPTNSATALPYGYGSTNLSAYPIMQFIGKIDLATQNGSEQLYVPENNAQWRDSTAIAIFDASATAADPGLNTNTQDKAIKMAFGPGFGNPNNGLVMYEAGHSHAKATLPDNIAAQRAFLNFVLLAGVVRGTNVNMTVPANIGAGQGVNLNATAQGGGGGYQYRWYSTCGGSFSNPSSATTNFTAPLSQGGCTIRVAVTDSCNRKTIEARTTIVEGPKADLAITKDDGQLTTKPGAPIAYTLTVTNNGPAPVTSMAIGDAISPTITNATFSPSTGAFAYNPTSQSGTWSGLNLAAGQAATLTLQGTVSSTATIGGTLVNTATVTPLGGVTDSNPANNSATDTDNIIAPIANITVSKDDNVTETSQDGNLTYSIRVKNDGPDQLTSLTIEDQIIQFKDDAATPQKGIDTTTPDKAGKDVMDKLSLVVSQGTLSSAPNAFGNNTNTIFTNNLGALTWQNVNLAPGQSAILTISGQVKIDNTKGALRNTVRLTPLSASSSPIGPVASASDTDNLIARGTEVALKITKSVSPAAPIAGQNLTYTLLVENSKNAADNARVIDQIPSDLSNVSWTCTTTAGTAPATQCDQASGTLSANNTLDTTADLANGGKVTYTITGKLDPSFTGNLINSATVNPKPGQFDNTPTDNVSTVSSSTNRKAALIVTKDDGITTAAPGQAIVYSIKVQNQGPSSINSVSLTEVIPDWILNPSFAIAQGSFSPTRTNGTPNDTWSGDWTNLNLIPGNAATNAVTLTVIGTVDPAATPGNNNLTNQVTIAAPTGAYTLDTANSTLTASDTDSIRAVADLAVTKTDNATTAIPGTSIGYTIAVKNNGPSAITSLKLTENYPTALLNPQISGPDGATLNSSGDWQGLNLKAGDEVSFIVSGTIDPTATGNLVNTVQVTPPIGTLDPQPTNDSASDTDQLKPVADLGITKTDGTAAIDAGEAMTYLVNITNYGPSAVNQAVFTDAVPATITGVTWNCNITTGTGSCASANGTGNGINTTVNLAKGATATYRIQGNLIPGAIAGSNLSNTAQIAVPIGTTDPITNNNSATDTDTIGRPTGSVDLSVTKTNNQTAVTPGSPIAYQIKVSNAGPGTIDNLILTDALPSDLLDPFFSTADGSYDSNNGAWSGFNLAPGDTIELNVDATLSVAPVQTKLTNTATVKPPIGFTDPNGGNNSATDEDPITIASAPANLLLVKRITAVNGQTTHDGRDLAAYVDTASAYDDNTLSNAQPADTDKWPTPLSNTLRGEINAGKVKPGDEIEYTIYFLSAGDRDVTQAKICDPLPSNTTYIPGSLELTIGGVSQALTDQSDGDKGQFFSPGSQPNGLSSALARCQNHPNGLALVDLGTVPKAATSGTSISSYGYIRLRARVNPTP